MNRLILFLIGVFTIVSCNSQTSTKSTAAMDSVDDIYQKNIQDSVLATGWYFIESDSTGFKRQLEKTEEVYFLNPRPIATSSNFKKVALGKNRYDDWYLGISLDKAGTQAWAEATLKAAEAEGQLGFVLNNRLLQAPRVNCQITKGMTAINSANYTKEEYEEFKRLIEK